LFTDISYTGLDKLVVHKRVLLVLITAFNHI